MILNFRTLAIASGLMVMGAAQAAVLFSQPTQTPEGFFADSVNYTPGTTFYEQAVADNFSLGTASNVTQIAFWGGSEGFFFPGLDNMTDFQINVYNSAFGLISANTVAKASLTPTVTGGTNSGGGTEYSFTFNTNIALAAGSYWLHVGGVYATPQDDAFVWASNNTMGDGTSAFADLSVTQAFTSAANTLSGVNFDQAFELRGDAVPEPASMAVLGLGFAALLRRRRK